MSTGVEIDSDDPYLLLPWYAAGTLSPAETARVDAALAADPALRASLARIEEERDETILRNEAFPHLGAGAADRLMARIEAEAPRRDRSARKGVLAWFAGLAPRTLAIAAVAAALVIVAQSGALVTLLSQGGSTTGEYVTASVEPPDSSTQSVLLVAFTDTASIADVTALLRTEKAVIIDGPKAGGLYRIAVPAADADTILAGLRARTDLVRFAGPSQ
jgi:hypothetical protein